MLPVLVFIQRLPEEKLHRRHVGRNVSHHPESAHITVATVQKKEMALPDAAMEPATEAEDASEPDEDATVPDAAMEPVPEAEDATQPDEVHG
ncbi:hypothetical protein AK812_SmicGene31637 [Symbiodinium microadriaticum]|uniref:Uncharacterized protein n=1 Tax=Symbiodinium microadriaticum TaxID=2951 RepID=A0A1Q9CWA6_SYMMI|nr:hypothetical protein AK812_SmicGene31637 [Symbiodinium microadriaticum]